MDQHQTVITARLLVLEFKNTQEESVEGCSIKLIDDENIFKWEVAIFGPPDTIFQGGYFKAHIDFPHNYPYSPPKMKFLNKFWHPNVYDSGDLCISILHPPLNDGSALDAERWTPTQCVRTVLLSVVSLLNEPNIESAANFEASMMYKRWKDSNGEDKEYENIVRKQVDDSKVDAEKDGVVVPTTLEDYCMKNTKSTAEVVDYTDFYDDNNVFEEEYSDDDDDDDDEET